MNEDKTTSERGISFIKDVEGHKNYAYLDTGGVWTIGVGHTGPEVCKDLKCTDEEINAWLKEDLLEAEEAIKRLVKVPLTQDQFDALVSFVFNIGMSQFSTSTMLKYLNTGKLHMVPNQFNRWVYDNGKLLSGLVKRRQLEAALFTGQLTTV